MDELEVLKKYFGYEGFRGNQRDIIKHMLEGEDMLVLMRTGGGKSICYQIPAIMTKNKLTLIISPLISLIVDQVKELRERDIPVHYYTSESELNFDTIFSDIVDGKCNILLTTPETFNMNKKLQKYLSSPQVDLARVVIDEAHCVSEWGHSFRPAYKQLNIKQRFPNVQVCAFTATATKIVQYEMCRLLDLNDPLLYVSSFLRENIRYSVQVRDPKEKEDNPVFQAKLLKLIKTDKRFINHTGIIYCFKRDTCDSLARFLKRSGLSAASYHSQSRNKDTIQADWTSGKTKIIVATTAFAMGVNKSNVRYVIHTCLPDSIETYYQQAGRAGRDGLPSIAVLYYNPADATFMKKLKRGDGKGAPVSPMQKIEDMLRYADNRTCCQKQWLSNYLGETDLGSCSDKEQKCQNCSNGCKTYVISDASRTRIMKQLPGNFHRIMRFATSEDKEFIRRQLNSSILETDMIMHEEGKFEEVLQIKKL